MNANEAVDVKLDQLAMTRFAGADDGLAALAEASAAINEALALEAVPYAGRAEERPLVVTNLIFQQRETRERLRRWIAKLKQIADAVARQSAGLSYSISVGIPGGVSVGVAWATPE
jgi:hypothetical protein